MTGELRYSSSIYACARFEKSGTVLSVWCVDHRCDVATGVATAVARAIVASDVGTRALEA